MTGLLYWVLAVLLLGVLIVVHELGHFGAARLCGLKVMSFGVGFGPKLWSRRGKDGTNYVLRALPLGGYCSFYGENEAVEDDGDALYRQAVWKRALMTFSGPLMNFVAALLILVLLFGAVGLPMVIPSVGMVDPNTPAAEAGLLAGDTFLRINDVDIKNSTDVRQAVAGAADQPLAMTILRDGQEIDLTLTPRLLSPEDTDARVGIGFATASHRFGLGEAINISFRYMGSAVKGMLEFLRDLIFQGQGVEGMVGPIGTLEVIKTETQSGGLPAYLELAALISINLGLFNLLPVPGLDGSRLVFLGVEAIRRKRVDPNKEGLVHLIGIGALLLLMLPIYFRDIVNLFR